MNLRITLALPLAAMLWTLPVHAATPPATSGSSLSREHFDQIDTDGSGSISEAEYMQFMEKAFKKLDTDGSGGLTLDEVKTLLTPEQFSTVDRNNDGKITLDELLEHVMAEFHQYDTNEDGKLQP